MSAESRWAALSRQGPFTSSLWGAFYAFGIDPLAAACAADAVTSLASRWLSHSHLLVPHAAHHSLMLTAGTGRALLRRSWTRPPATKAEMVCSKPQ